jgi:transposase
MKVLKMSEKFEILKRYVAGEAIRSIARNCQRSRNTIRKYTREFDEGLTKLKTATEEDKNELIRQLVEPHKYKSGERKRRKLTEEIQNEIIKCLKENEVKRNDGRRKIQMKNIDIYEYLEEKGFDIGYTTVCNFTREYEDRRKEAYIKQEYNPGETLEFDYGEVPLEIGEKRRKLDLALFTTADGSCHFSKIYENKKTVNYLDAHVKAFEYYDGVHREIVYDNLKQAVARFTGPNGKEATDALKKISLYYGFNYRFCNARRGNEKGHVERGVEYVRRKVFSRKSKFETVEEANKYLLEKLAILNSKSKKRFDGKSPFDKLEIEKEYLLPLKPTYDVSETAECRISKYSFAKVEQNSYSVPDYLVGKFVNARIFSEEIKFYYKENLIARHERSYKNHDCKLNINHYLTTLERKPGALKSSLALKTLAPEIQKIYNNFYNDNSIRKSKEFIELLKIIKVKGLEKVKEVIDELKKNKIAMVTTANIKNLVEQDNSKTIQNKYNFVLNNPSIKDSEIAKQSNELLESLDELYGLDTVALEAGGINE